MLWIRDIYSRSRIRIFLSRIQALKDSGSRIRIRFKEFKYFLTQNMFLSSRKYDPWCSSRIRIFSHPGSWIKIAQDPGSATLPERQDSYLKNHNEFNKVLFSSRASHFPSYVQYVSTDMTRDVRPKCTENNGHMFGMSMCKTHVGLHPTLRSLHSTALVFWTYYYC